MSRISMELQRLEAAIVRLEQAVETADQRRDSAWRETGEKMDLTVERVDRAIHRLETGMRQSKGHWVDTIDRDPSPDRDRLQRRFGVSCHIAMRMERMDALAGLRGLRPGDSERSGFAAGFRDSDSATNQSRGPPSAAILLVT